MDKNWLISCFQKDLPGEAAHAPYKRYRAAFENKDRESARSAAVGIHIYQENQQLYFYLIERSTYNGQHSGQMAFPGGKQDPSDSDLEFTARRESEEELGIHHKSGELIKQLTEVWIPVSGFVVSPYVFFHEKKPTLLINEREVAQVESIAIPLLLEDTTIEFRDINLPNEGKLKEHPCFVFNEKVVWGATALMLNEVRILLSETTNR
jgi:8-oxo-dGTP pyrophosphatase MutT (NUDIX family)